MISDDKMTHIVHLMLDGIQKAGMATYSDKEQAVRESRKICLSYLSQLNKVGDIVRERILSQKNAPIENSPQWDNLYEKYYDEEMRRRGGA